ncbi:hypothetical protein C8R43DRAFT_1134910 [Mycena crocata]|nr:hypothetical protein C8R43DRAFT_1134910 [Mycena crocata]
MISASDHHHQSVPAVLLAPPTTPSTFQPPNAGPTHSNDLLAAHYHRLESLLDSALATLTIIHCTAICTGPILNPHMTDVLKVLTRLSAASASAPPPPTHSSAPDSIPSQSVKTATYAQAVRTATDRAETPTEAKPNMAKQSTDPPLRSPTPTHPASKPDLVFRFDTEPPRASPIPSPAALFKTIGVKSVLDRVTLNGVWWTQKGNLALHLVGLDDEPISADDALARAPAIWGAIRVLLGFSKAHPCPRVDTGVPWHIVIARNVPIWDKITRSYSPAEWLKGGGFQGKMEAFSFMCNRDDFMTKKFVPVRISLSSKADADILVQNGALLWGSQCKVSHYIARNR